MSSSEHKVHAQKCKRQYWRINEVHDIIIKVEYCREGDLKGSQDIITIKMILQENGPRDNLNTSNLL